MPRGALAVATKAKTKTSKPRKKKKEADQNDTSLPRCLGWCGGKRFEPRFRHDHYCVKCAAKKDAIEKGLSKREEAIVNGHYRDTPSVWDDD